MNRVAAVLLLVFSLGACNGASDGEADGGAPDSGGTDGGTRDEGTTDDAGAPDAGGADTGTPDAGEPEQFHVVAEHPPVGPAGAPYSHAFLAKAGVEPYGGWKVVKGELPGGLSLDAATGVLSGSPSAEGFFYFVVEVTDAAAAVARELFGLRIGDPAAPGAWKKRADAFHEVYETRHIWHGWSLNMYKPDDPDGNYWLSTYGDSSFMGGQCTMAMAFRHAVEQSPASFSTITTLVDGWAFFQRLTGVPGLTGRGFAHKDDPSQPGFKDGPFWPDDPESRMYKGTGEFADWVWMGDASRDQFTGAVLGNAMAYDLVDDQHVKDTTRGFLVALADHVWDHDLWIVDPGDRKTQYGDMDGERWEGFDAPNGQTAVCDLAWFKIAHHVSGEERFERYYRILAKNRDYVGIMRDAQWVYMGYQTKHYNVYMSNENWFHLMRLEDDLELVPQYREIYRDTLWLNTADKTPNRKGIKETNAVTAPWYMYSTGDRDPVALWDVLWTLSTFPDPPLRDHAVKNSDDPTIEKNPAFPEEALYALPFHRRQGDMVVWHRNPFTLDGGSDSGEQRTGCDYLLPYWMGRYYGYISEQW
jgi:hypothetical protein